MTVEAAFEAQGRALCDRLIKLTPPLSGKSIKRGLWARDIAGMADYKARLLGESQGDLKAAFEKFSPFRDAEIEDMSAKAIGERRVERDIRKVIKGVRGAVMPRRHAKVIVSQSESHDEQVDWAGGKNVRTKRRFGFMPTAAEMFMAWTPNIFCRTQR
jgi:hypothetical protein